MDITGLTRREKERSYLDGQLLIAMPHVFDSNFDRTVIYICAHSGDGAMGFILNRPQPMSFCDLLVQLKVISSDDAICLPTRARDMAVQAGGPVDTGRGFVLHSDDYLSDSTMPVSDELCMTATVDILRAISKGKGPHRATMMLGYAGWGPGQLEAEIGENGWLTCPASDDIVYDRALPDKYDRVLASMGINPAMLSRESGHA
ncbi:YqgE/AlgH family protein [Pararhizobium haloflavum]|uniref:YqgE/AlgH family protein n=1 Tax=Pararhizobium haloflavum TaxID=2037914 RepID=UPI000C18449D|nr:YqgE/AlgH family protein [Pararhizobium haloflavum]